MLMPICKDLSHILRWNILWMPFGLSFAGIITSQNPVGTINKNILNNLKNKLKFVYLFFLFIYYLKKKFSIIFFF